MAIDKRSGFTLIELIIVMAITAIIIVGSYNIIGLNFKSQNELELSAREIVSVLRNAQDRSISQEDSGQWGVYFENSVSDSNFYFLYKGATTTFISKKILQSNIQFLDPSIGNVKDISFNKMDGLPISPATVVISLKNNLLASTTIIINSNGQIQYK